MENTLNYIKNIIKDFTPKIGIILGSGLGEFADENNEISIPYSEIPDFPLSTVKGHGGKLVFANIENKNIVMMQGRFHFYEGHSIKKVIFPIKIFKKLGVETLIITNAAGGISSDFKAGDFMLIKDHINLMGTNPLIGQNDESLGERFADMTNIYKSDLRNLAKSVAQSMNIDIKEGVYAAMTGPSYETPAEINMLKIIGASAVGMSTVPEAIFANYCNINILGISCITNMASGISKHSLSHSEVIETANFSKNNFKNLLRNIIKQL